MSIRDEINQVLNTLPEESLEYARFIQEPDEVEPTEAEIKAIARGREEYAKGEYVSWRDIKTDAV